MKKSLILFFILLSCDVSQSRQSFLAKTEQEKNLRHFLAKGNLHLANSELARAKASYEVARELKPNDPRVLDALGAVAFREKSYHLAKYYFKKAISLDSLYDRPYVHLALIMEEEGKVDVAKDLLQRAIKINPLNHRAKNNYAALLIKGKDKFSKSESLLNQSQAIYNTDPVIKFNLDSLTKSKFLNSLRK